MTAFTIDKIGKEQDKILMNIEKGSEPYLTEKKLGNILQVLFPHSTIIYDRLLSKEIKLRPDYLIKEERLIVEFQGSQHYTKGFQVFKDSERITIFESLGFKVIEIPYFIQPTKDILSLLFGDYTGVEPEDMSNEYECGFIHPLSLSFGDFCSSGLNKAENFIKSLPVKEHNDILRSMEKRAEINKIPIEFYNPLS
ncbi:MAG: DUF559 domain-containing protein [Candidatus Shapirobacteria bacterium]